MFDVTTLAQQRNVVECRPQQAWLFGKHGVSIATGTITGNGRQLHTGDEHDFVLETTSHHALPKLGQRAAERSVPQRAGSAPVHCRLAAAVAESSPEDARMWNGSYIFSTVKRIGNRQFGNRPVQRETLTLSIWNAHENSGRLQFRSQRELAHTPTALVLASIALHPPEVAVPDYPS